MTGETDADGDDAPRCGFETQDGTPCRLPTTEDGDPERCYLPSHQEGVDAEAPHCKFDAVREDLLDAARTGATKEGIARAAGIHKDTLYRYLRDREAFKREFLKARWEGEKQLLANADERGARFVLERSYGYVKTEKREIEADVTQREAAAKTADYEVIGDDEDVDVAADSSDESRFRYK